MKRNTICILLSFVAVSISANAHASGFKKQISKEIRQADGCGCECDDDDDDDDTE